MEISMKIKTNQIWANNSQIFLILDAGHTPEEIQFIYFFDGKYKYAYSCELFRSLFKYIGEL
jgi:hypothetical protein